MPVFRPGEFDRTHKTLDREYSISPVVKILRTSSAENRLVAEGPMRPALQEQSMHARFRWTRLAASHNSDKLDRDSPLLEAFYARWSCGPIGDEEIYLCHRAQQPLGCHTDFGVIRDHHSPL